MKDFEAYCVYVNKLINRSSPVHHQLKKERNSKMSGSIQSNRVRSVPQAEKDKTGVLYKDACFDFIEEVSVTSDGNIKRLRYVYDFECWNTSKKLSFRYDKDPNLRRPDHPLHHLHANSEEPRYPTAEVSLDQIIEFLHTQLGCGSD